ncbi:molecular chaperone DnaJ [Trichocoleus sp. FACHB-262]|nr:molecular chaperone DnaJ [Trichocoleus sp. FACHB-262]
MPKTTAKAKSAKTDKEKNSAQLNSFLKNEASRLAERYGVSTSVFEEFACFVIENHKKKDPVIKPPQIKPLTLAQIKAAIYQNFSVKNTTELKKSGAFKMATDGMNISKLSVKEDWEKLYRKFVGVLPGEENQQGYGCINGVNIFNYFKPWQVFALDSKTATHKDIQSAYHQLSKIYHPDNSKTGDAAIFDRLTIMYKSISAEA